MSFRTRDRILPDTERSRLLVTLKPGHGAAAFDGLVWDVDERTVVLKDVEAIDAQGGRVKADGEVLVPRDAIAYSQRPTH